MIFFYKFVLNFRETVLILRNYSEFILDLNFMSICISYKKKTMDIRIL